MMDQYPWVVAAVLAVLGVGFAGVRGLREVAEYLGGLVRRRPWWTVAVLGLVIAIPVVGGRYVHLRPYAALLVTSTLAFGGIWLTAIRFHRHLERPVDWLLRLPVPLVAFTATVAAATIGWFVFDAVPHVSDEVAYQFQAKAMIQSRLALLPPPDGDAFGFLHTMVDGGGGRWFGIMNPGWPLILAAGYLVGTPWLINPIIIGLCLIVMARVLTAMGWDPVERGTAILLMAVCPLFLVMGGSFMSHPANLLVFLLFLWAWVRLYDSPAIRWAMLAGATMALAALIRPVDSLAVALPFAVSGLASLRRRPALTPYLLAVAAVASAGPALTLAYNARQTGDPTVMPVTRYFEVRNPAERFGLGFGEDMGTTLHGPEWPGYYPIDAPVVTSHRVTQLLVDLWGLPLIAGSLLVWGLVEGWRRNRPWFRLLVWSAGGLVAIYTLHFYHGIAYGSRHYYLALPLLVMAVAGTLADGLRATADSRRRMARGALVAFLGTVLVVTYPPLLATYSQSYRSASGAIRDAIRQAGLDNALVFVAGDNWGWKSAFPLNDYPLDENAVLVAKERDPSANAAVMRLYPERRVYYLREVAPGDVQLREAPPDP